MHGRSGLRLLSALMGLLTENALGGTAAGFGLGCLSAVPEPAAWALAATGLVVPARRVPRRQPGRR